MQQLLRSDHTILASIIVLNREDKPFGVRKIAQLSQYNKSTVSRVIRRLRAGGYLRYERGPGRHYAYTILKMPNIEDLMAYLAAIEARIRIDNERRLSDGPDS